MMAQQNPQYIPGKFSGHGHHDNIRLVVTGHPWWLNKTHSTFQVSSQVMGTMIASDLLVSGSSPMMAQQNPQYIPGKFSGHGHHDNIRLVSDRGPAPMMAQQNPQYIPGKFSGHGHHDNIRFVSDRGPAPMMAQQNPQYIPGKFSGHGHHDNIRLAVTGVQHPWWLNKTHSTFQVSSQVMDTMITSDL